MKKTYEIFINGNEKNVIKIEANSEEEAAEKFKNFMNFCYNEDIFLEELSDNDEESIETIDEDKFVCGEEVDDLDDLYDEKMISLLFGNNKPKKAIIVNFE